MPTISDLETKVDELAIATEAALAKKASAAAADQSLFDAVADGLGDATRAAKRSHDRLVGHNAQVGAAADGWIATSGDRTPKVDAASAAYTALRADLASQLGIGVTALDSRLGDIDALDDTLQTAVDDASNAVDVAREAWIDAHADVTKATLAVERVRSRIGQLTGEFAAAIERANASMTEARRLMTREEDASNRAAATHVHFALEARTRLDADFGSSDDAIDSDAGAATAFTGPWGTAWEALVDAEHELHSRSLDLQRALLAEAEAVAALREHERGLPYDSALEPIFPDA